MGDERTPSKKQQFEAQEEESHRNDEATGKLNSRLSLLVLAAGLPFPRESTPGSSLSTSRLTWLLHLGLGHFGSGPSRRKRMR